MGFFGEKSAVVGSVGEFDAIPVAETDGRPWSVAWSASSRIWPFWLSGFEFLAFSGDINVSANIATFKSFVTCQSLGSSGSASAA